MESNTDALGYPGKNIHNLGLFNSSSGFTMVKLMYVINMIKQSEIYIHQCSWILVPDTLMWIWVL